MFDLDLPALRISVLARTRLLAWLDRLLRSGWQARAQHTSAGVLERVLERFPYAALLLSGFGIQRAVPPAAPVPHELRRSRAPLPQVAPESLIRQLEAGGEWQARVHAARALAHLESPEVIDVLICALRDPSAEVAAAVVDALAAKQAPRVGEVLQRVLSNSDGYFSSITRAAALSALARRAEMTRVFAAVHDLDAAVSVAANRGDRRARAAGRVRAPDAGVARSIELLPSTDARGRSARARDERRAAARRGAGAARYGARRDGPRPCGAGPRAPPASSRRAPASLPCARG